jgi:hypothetical protein
MNSPLPQRPLESLVQLLCPLYLTADIVATQTDVCFVPIADIGVMSAALKFLMKPSAS